MTAWPISQDAATLHRSALVWDNHVCLPHVHEEKWMMDLLRHQQAGANIVLVNLGDAEIPFEEQVSMANYYRTWILRHPDKMLLIETPADIRKAAENNLLGVAFDVEGLYSIEDRIERVALYYELGVRWMLMAYNKNNLAAGGCHDDDQGLTPYGYQVIAEMDRLGMVKCCTHTGYKSVMDVMTNTDKPTIFSHSNPRGLKDHPRNIPDELIVASAKTGGVICINGVSLFLGEGEGAACAARIADHIQYVVDLVGDDHVGLGLDHVYDMEGMFDELAKSRDIWPADLGYSEGIKIAGPEELPLITDELIKRNMSEDAIRKILGGNLVRVADQVWQS
ncbi:MAG: membrane dipeptidase [Alphaproteobacteria bacterium]